MDNQNTSTLPLRTDKTIAWLMESRDQWKRKCLKVKLKLKRQTLALKRARKGRSLFKKEHKSLKEQNRKLELSIQSHQEKLSELKKKYSSKKMI